MARTMTRLITGLGLAFGLAQPATARANTGEIPPDIQVYLDDFRSAVAQVDDARLVFSRREWLSGSYRPYQELSMAFRKNGDIYIKFSGESFNGREILWLPSVDGSYMLVKPSPILPVLRLDPEGTLAKKDSRHPIGLATFHALADRILSELDKLTTDPNLSGKYLNLGSKTVKERRTECFQVDLPRDVDPSLYADRIAICLDIRTHLPVTLQAWNQSDGDYRLVEDYSWTNVEINPGLTDATFDAKNPSYNF